MLDASRCFLFIQRRWTSTSEINVVSSTTNAAPTRLISRRLLLQYQQHVKSKAASKSGPNTKQNAAKDETPWPRNIVYGAYVVMSICIPYSIAWFLSSNEPLRSAIFPNSKYYESSYIIKWMRNHFGMPDYECIAEPEAVQLLLSNRPVPHRFIDEPTKRIRQQQLYIDRQHEQNVKFRLITGTATNMEAVTELDLPAKTLARYDELVKVIPNNISIQPPIALDFYDNDDDDDEDINIDLSSENDDTPSECSDDLITTVPPMSIYSLWHYHPPKLDVDNTMHVNPVLQMSPIDMELSRIQYEMDLLQQELQHQSLSSQQQRPIDDIQEEIVKLKSLRRQLQWKKWLPW